MDDDTWVDEAVAAAGPCPTCGARVARPIVYGLPDLTFYEQLAERVVFAGCCLPEVLYRWSCGRCGTSWSEHALGEPQEDEDRRT